MESSSALPSAAIPMIGCPYCGAIQELPPLPPHGYAICVRCESELESSGRSIAVAFALTVTMLLLLFPAYLFPFLSFTKDGFFSQSHLGSGVRVLFDQHQLLLAICVTLFAIVFPVIYSALLCVSLGALLFGRRPRWLPYTFRLATNLQPWAMSDVFLLACVVGYNRISPYVRVHLHAGAYCFIAAAFFSMVAYATFDRRIVWRMIGIKYVPAINGPAISCGACDLLLPESLEGGLCPRCFARVYARKPDSLVRTLALVIAGCMLYVPANVYPMSTMIMLGKAHPHTIFWGIERLVKADLLPLAVLIFCTSILFPMVKLVSLSWFLVSVHRKSKHHLRFKTKMHQFIGHIGRWSNMDPFTIMVFAPLVQFGDLASIHSGIGAASFLSVVTLSMFAARSFDPRLMWDAAEGE